MIRLVMERSELTFWPLFSMVLFLVSCAVMLVWLYRPGSSEFYGRVSRLALGSDEPGQGKERDHGREG